MVVGALVGAVAGLALIGFVAALMALGLVEINPPRSTDSTVEASGELAAADVVDVTAPVATTSTSSTPAPELAASAEPATPYDHFLQLVVEHDLVADVPATLDEGDALTRALLGCSTAWPEGSVDWALGIAYAGECERFGQ